jgi:hypothetical protein
MMPHCHNLSQPSFLALRRVTYSLRSATSSAAAASSHPAARIFSAVLPHFGQIANQSPGINASLRGATVFFHLQSSHTNVKGLGFIGINTFS